MKAYKVIIIIFSLMVCHNSYAQKPLYAFLNYIPFYSPIQHSAYIETYITVIGNSTIFKLNKNNKYQSSVEITMLFKQDGVIKEFKKYNLNSPEIIDTTKAKPNFIDQQRITLAQGIYNYELFINDVNDTVNKDKKFNYHDIISVNFDTTDIDISGIELIERYYPTVKENILSKSGYDLIPYVSNFYPQNINRLIFYSEIYNTDSKKYNGENFLIRYYIENEKNKTIVEDCNRFKKQKAAKVVVAFSEFNIEKLPSGNYNLVIEVRNKNNEIIKIKKVYFQRSNPRIDTKLTDITTINVESTFIAKITNIDTLTEYLKCIIPIADRSEKLFIENQIKLKNIEYMQKFFYNFWLSRNYNKPEEEWNLYYKQVILVNNNYSTKVKKGYDTDQGRVFLQYGAPNDIVFDKHDPSAYPYEIWSYYKVNEQTNRKFVFYCPDLTGFDYVLLHSDVKGEIYTKNWETVLHKRDTPVYDYNQQTEFDYYGSHIKENFNK